MIPVVPFLQRCAFVKKIPVFSTLNWYRIQLIARNGSLLRFKKGDIVSKKGNPPDFVFFVLSGRLISYISDGGKRRDDAEHVHRGMFFGIISALTGEVHSQTFEAMNDSLIFCLPVTKLKRLLKKIPDLSIKFSKALSQRIRSHVTNTELVDRTTIISVYSPIAGSGSSTYSLNLAWSLSKETSDKVALVSIRSRKAPQPTTSSAFDHVRPKWKITPKSLATIANIEEISTIMHKSEIGADMLNVVFDPAVESQVEQIADFVNGFIDEYRYVIVDLPSELDDVVLKTLSQSDLIHLVLARSREALENGRAIITRLEFSLNRSFNQERVRIIIGGVHGHRNVSEATVHSIIDYPVLAFLPLIQEKDLAAEIGTSVIHFWALDVHCPYWMAITRVARQVSGVSVGLVLGGGAAFGLAHVGVIKVLEEENIPIDFIAGSSMGALIGSLWAVGYKASELEKMAHEFRDKSNLIKLLDFVFPLSGLISGKAIMAWLFSKFDQKTFSDVRIPLKIVAYDLIHRQDIVIESGSLVDAVRKSISIPGVFQPIITDDQIIIDGGVMNPLPTNVLVSSDVKKIIAVNVLQTPDDVIKSYERTQKVIRKSLSEPFLKDPWFFVDIRFRFWVNRMFFPNISDIIVRTLEASESVIAEQSARAADVLIHPDLVGLNWYELYEAETLIQRGEEATRAQLPRIKEIIQNKKR
ncbi:MAG: patatin-like phospholipase family protein [Candidatus Omnitrophica bacterium]|nr:patatin-like phospholipase family protein [Candidatus Omnitrophota bacterium]